MSKFPIKQNDALKTLIATGEIEIRTQNGFIVMRIGSDLFTLISGFTIVRSVLMNEGTDESPRWKQHIYPKSGTYVALAPSEKRGTYGSHNGIVSLALPDGNMLIAKQLSGLQPRTLAALEKMGIQLGEPVISLPPGASVFISEEATSLYEQHPFAITDLQLAPPIPEDRSQVKAPGDILLVTDKNPVQSRIQL